METRKIVSVLNTTNCNPVLYRNEMQLGKQLSKKQLSSKDIISTVVTTGNAPNKLDLPNYIVEENYAIANEDSNEQGVMNKIKVLPSKTSLTAITIMVVNTIAIYS